MGWLGLGAASLARRSRRGASPAISAIAVPALGGLADGDQVQSGLSAGALDTANYAGADGAIASVTASVTINGAAGALADVVSAGDTVSVVITVEDDAGNSRAFFAGARTVAGVAPGLAVSDSLSGRTVTIAVDSVSGAPAPATVLTALSLDGASVLGDQTGSGPWSYAVPDSAASRAVAWTVEASNFEGSATVSGSEGVAPSLFAPTITSAPTISGTMAPGQTVTLDAGTYSGTAPITITFTLALDGADVTGAVVSGSYTLPAGTEGQSLVYTETASNGIPPDTTQSATETVQALPAFPEASGGTETAITDPVTLDAYTAHMFTADGPLTVTEGGEFEVLLVGPGGPGGSTWGYTASGAGAGGDVVLQTLTLPAGTYNITLGTVGAPCSDWSDPWHTDNGLRADCSPRRRGGWKAER